MGGGVGEGEISRTGETAGDVAIDDDLDIVVRDRLFVIPGVREIVEELLTPRGSDLHSACISGVGNFVSAEKVPPDIAGPPRGRRHGAPIAPRPRFAAPPRDGIDGTAKTASPRRTSPLGHNIDTGGFGHARNKPGKQPALT
jgi:hypothetical protein